MDGERDTKEIGRQVVKQSQVAQWLGAGTLIVTCLFFLTALSLLVYQGFKLRQVVERLDDLASANRSSLVRQNALAADAVACLNLRLLEHREANEYAHRLLAEKLKAPYDEPQRLTPQQPDESLRGSCDRLAEALKQQQNGGER